jgi:hypothetical protein
LSERRSPELQILFTRGESASSAVITPVWLDREIISFFTAPGWALKLPSGDSLSANRFARSLKKKYGHMGSGPLAAIWASCALIYLLDGEQKTRREYHVADESFPRRCHQTSNCKTNPPHRTSGLSGLPPHQRRVELSENRFGGRGTGECCELTSPSARGVRVACESRRLQN